MSKTRKSTPKPVACAKQGGFTAVSLENGQFSAYDARTLSGPEYKLVRQTHEFLPEINGAGQVVIYQCDASSVIRATKSIFWTAGRLSHRGCCGRSAVINPTSSTQHVQGTKAELVVRTARGGDRILTTTTSPATALTPHSFSGLLPKEGLELRVTQGHTRVSWSLSPAIGSVLAWIQELRTHGVKAGPPPELDLGAERLMQATYRIQHALAMVEKSIDSARRTITLDSSTPAPQIYGPAPVFCPNLAWRDDATNVNWSTVRSKRFPDAPALAQEFTPLERAALTVLLSQTYAAFTDAERALPNADDVQAGLGLQSPDLASGAHAALPANRYFQYTPPNWDLAPGQGTEYEGSTLEDYGSWTMTQFPPMRVALPNNWRDHPRDWRWMDDQDQKAWSKVLIEWSPAFETFRETIVGTQDEEE